MVKQLWETLIKKWNRYNFAMNHILYMQNLLGKGRICAQHFNVFDHTKKIVNMVYYTIEIIEICIDWRLIRYYTHMWSEVYAWHFHKWVNNHIYWFKLTGDLYTCNFIIELDFLTRANDFQQGYPPSLRNHTQGNIGEPALQILAPKET